MRIAEQTAHKRPQPMPVMDKLGSSTLDDFGFTGHSKGCSMNPRKVDKVFLGAAQNGPNFIGLGRMADFTWPVMSV
jgi:hypothetical protein